MPKMIDREYRDGRLCTLENFLKSRAILPNFMTEALSFHIRNMDRTNTLTHGISYFFAPPFQSKPRVRCDK